MPSIRLKTGSTAIILKCSGPPIGWAGSSIQILFGPRGQDLGCYNSHSLLLPTFSRTHDRNLNNHLSLSRRRPDIELGIDSVVVNADTPKMPTEESVARANYKDHAGSKYHNRHRRFPRDCKECNRACYALLSKAVVCCENGKEALSQRRHG